MTRRIRIRAVERQQIDLDKLAFALLRLASDRLAERDQSAKVEKAPEPSDE
jgi:hypothetical protein